LSEFPISSPVARKPYACRPHRVKFTLTEEPDA